MVKKRSQITLFIIIGLAILIAAMLLLYIRSLTPPSDPDPSQQDPVKAYVEQCAFQTAEDAIELLGLQAGYVNLEGADTITAKYDPSNSAVLAVSDGKLLLPYWLYQNRPGLDRSEMPALHKSYEGDYSIQWQIEDYINTHLESCVEGFSVFEPQGLKVTEMGILETEVSFTESSVRITLNYPLRVNKPQGDVQSISVFQTSVPVRLSRVYSLAKDIRDHEMETVFLERNTRNLISMYSRIDSDYLPPMYGGLHFEPCSRRVFWLYNDVYGNFREMLTANIPFLRVEHTDYEPVRVRDGPDRRLRQGVYTGMVHRVSEQTYPSMQVDFSYLPEFPLEIDFGGYGILEPHSFAVDLLFSQLCMFEYQFAYNVKHPVLVAITDASSKVNGQQFLFQFPLEVVLKDNYPRVSYQDAFSTPELPAVRSECEPEQRLSGIVTLNVVDADGNGIDQADVMFQCGPSMVYEFNASGHVEAIRPFADSCYIGSTSYGTLRSRFPQCVGGGILTLRKDGYVKWTGLVGDMVQGQERTLTVTLEQIVEKPVTVRKLFVKSHDETDPRPGIVISDGEVVQCNVYEESMGLLANEQAVIRLTKLDPEAGEVPGPLIAFYEPGEEATLHIAPGTYLVDVMLIRNERYNGEMTITKNSQSYTVPGSLVSDAKTFKYPEKDVLLPTVFSGGALFQWSVTAEQLARTESLTFYVFDEGAPKRLEDVNMPLKHREACSELNIAKVMPG